MTTEDEPDALSEIKTVTTKAIELRIEKILHEFGHRLQPWEWGKIFELLCPEIYAGQRVEIKAPNIAHNRRPLLPREKKVYFLNFGNEMPDE